MEIFHYFGFEGLDCCLTVSLGVVKVFSTNYNGQTSFMPALLTLQNVAADKWVTIAGKKRKL